MKNNNYELIANVLKDMNDKYDGDDWTVNGTIYLYARNIAAALQQADPNFDYEKFMTECGEA
jgi:hypothetical protein